MRAWIIGCLVIAAGACHDDTARRVAITVRQQSTGQPSAGDGQTHHARNGMAELERPTGVVPAETATPRAMNEMTGRR